MLQFKDESKKIDFKWVYTRILQFLKGFVSN